MKKVSSGQSAVGSESVGSMQSAVGSELRSADGGLPTNKHPKGWIETTISEVSILNPKSDLNDNLEIGFSPMALIPVNFSEKEVLLILWMVT
jgi:hypothetical protein